MYLCICHAASSHYVSAIDCGRSGRIAEKSEKKGMIQAMMIYNKLCLINSQKEKKIVKEEKKGRE